jgi:hypothetical protein
LLTKGILRCAPITTTFFKTNYKILLKTQNASKKNKTQHFYKSSFYCQSSIPATITPIRYFSLMKSSILNLSLEHANLHCKFLFHCFKFLLE